MMTLFWHATMFLGVAASAVGLDTRALIEQALDEPAKITLDHMKLGDAIRVITEQTGVKIFMAEEVMNLVPHGADTTVQKVEIANIPLRQALTELFSPLGMTFLVRENHLEIVPKEPLKCLGRPPNWTELETLAALSSVEPGLDPDALASLESRMQFQVPIPGAWAVLSEMIRNVGAGPGDEVLTAACRNLGWAWSLLDRRIVVTPLEEQIRRQLRQPISLRMNNRPLFDVMLAVGRRTNVNVRAEPGALASLPIPMQRNFSLNAARQPAEQVLDSIAAYTGLGYLIEPDGILFYQPMGGGGRFPNGMQQPERAPATDPYVAKMVIPLANGKSIEWLIRRSELPEDLRRMRERDLTELFEEVRRRDAARQP